jgi:hypothetical protein
VAQLTHQDMNTQKKVSLRPGTCLQLRSIFMEPAVVSELKHPPKVAKAKWSKRKEMNRKDEQKSLTLGAQINQAIDPGIPGQVH